jgi:hypothetical protein
MLLKLCTKMEAPLYAFEEIMKWARKAVVEGYVYYLYGKPIIPRYLKWKNGCVWRTIIQKKLVSTSLDSRTQLILSNSWLPITLIPLRITGSVTGKRSFGSHTLVSGGTDGLPATPKIAKNLPASYCLVKNVPEAIM